MSLSYNNTLWCFNGCITHMMVKEDFQLGLNQSGMSWHLRVFSKSITNYQWLYFEINIQFSILNLWKVHTYSELLIIRWSHFLVIQYCTEMFCLFVQFQVKRSPVPLDTKWKRGYTVNTSVCYPLKLLLTMWILQGFCDILGITFFFWNILLYNYGWDEVMASNIYFLGIFYLVSIEMLNKSPTDSPPYHLFVMLKNVQLRVGGNSHWITTSMIRVWHDQCIYIDYTVLGLYDAVGI